MDLVGRKEEAVCSELQLMSTQTPEGLAMLWTARSALILAAPLGIGRKLKECVSKSQGKVRRVRVRRCRRQSSDCSCVPF